MQWFYSTLLPLGPSLLKWFRRKHRLSRKKKAYSVPSPWREKDGRRLWRQWRKGYLVAPGILQLLGILSVQVGLSHLDDLAFLVVPVLQAFLICPSLGCQGLPSAPCHLFYLQMKRWMSDLWMSELMSDLTNASPSTSKSILLLIV